VRGIADVAKQVPLKAHHNTHTTHKGSLHVLSVCHHSVRASTVLTATLFFPQPTWRSGASTDFYAKWLNRRGFAQGRAFLGQNQNLFKPLTPRPPKPSHFGKFSDLENFC